MANNRNPDDTIISLLGAPDEINKALRTPVPADLSGFVQRPEADDEDEEDSQIGAFIGRYQIIRRLGKGGFGIVFLARDSDLDRLVAIKLPHIHRMQSDRDRRLYLQEARTLAQLDHFAIVPIYDCGVIADGRCFVVSKYIEGRDLSHVLSQGRVPVSDIARLLADAAEALHHVHQAKIVHRDIKPANLLLGDDGRIYVADFGLALRDDPVPHAAEGLAGTPNYMSPEQVRGEGHRVDGRSDQFSVGVVMYELLTGERPFSGGASHDIFYRILSQDPVPPRQLNRSVPSELNRICLKLLSKLASQRYHETLQLTYELREWLKHAEGQSTDLQSPPTGPAARIGQSAATTARSKDSVTVVPRGLRAFTRADAYFFPGLLPGTRDRDGLPASLSHWRRWVAVRDEAPDVQRVGVISGPTGCGKSSLVRAGLIPLLGTDVVTVLLEATPDLTERQLLATLERNCSAPLGDNLPDNLPDTLAAIRRGGGISPRKTLLIVLDQFEQWLHAHPEPLDSELVRAIRQCDGIRVQCLLLIRDDFWLALSRFMEAVESPLQFGRNALMIDLFDRRHARNVLIDFGRGYSQIRPAPEPLERDQERFIEGAIDNLLTDGKVVPVHLALFAEMVKFRDWTPSTLRILGGTVGIGAQFLNESFSAAYAPANQRTHDPAARSILQALLPALGTEIKASRRSRAELLALSGYEHDRSRFDMLMTILESDLKLIGATEFVDRSRSDSNPLSTEQTSYQLSHDFLVPSIREWLTARQRESFRGRLHQRLTELASLWNQQKETRFLPNFWEWGMVRVCLKRNVLSPAEARMLAIKDRRSITAICMAIASALLLGFVVHRYQAGTRINALQEQLATADFEQIPRIIEELSQYGGNAHKSVTVAASQSQTDSHAKFALQLAQLRWNSEPLEDVFRHVLKASSPESAIVASKELIAYADGLAPRCWQLIRTAEMAPGSDHPMTDDGRFRACVLLAQLDPPKDPESIQRWNSSASAISDLLIQACTRHPNEYRMLATSLQPAATILIPHLARYLGAAQEDRSAGFAVSLLASYSDSDARLRTKLCLDAAEWQKDLIVPQREDLVPDVLWEIVRTSPGEMNSVDEQSRIARRRANAAALLLTLPDERNLNEAWLLLLRSSDNIRNTTRSHLIRLMSRTKVPLDRILARLRTDSDPGIQYALILAIGDYPATSPAITGDVRAFLRQIYHTAPDSGVHSAAEWLLKRWGERNAIAALPVESADSARSGPPQPRQWMRTLRLETCEGHSLVRVDGTASEKIGRDFLIAAYEVTVQQVGDFDPRQYYSADYSRTPDSPMSVVEWRMAAAYCNWLSRREGLPEFYPADAEAWVPSSEDLKQPGYRLPTEAEWELASLAGSQTDRFFGSDGDLLSGYGWSMENNREYLTSIGAPHMDAQTREPITISKPVGLLRPNDFGLFDVYGNVAEWCNDISLVVAGERGLRGGAAGGFSIYLDSVSVGSAPPRIQYNSHGFRVARTIETR